jgi:AmiR/NasT family two-component response regulator
MCSHEDQIVTQALDLAERLLEAVARSNVRWREIEHLADTLAKLAARAASRQEVAESNG